MKFFALVLFIITYALLIALPRRRPWIALASAAVFICSGILSPAEALAAVDWNILMMLAGTMGTVILFIQSKMPACIADKLLQKMPNGMWAVAALALFTGIISSFIDNVATLLIVAPIGFAVAERLNISPVSLLIVISVSSNLQGAATLVGDTTSILLGSYAHMDFADFFFMQGKPSIFFAVELGALATMPVILFLFRRERGKIPQTEPSQAEDAVPACLLLVNIVLLIVASFFPDKPVMTNGVLCLLVFLTGMIYSLIRRNKFAMKKALRQINYDTLLLLASLFVIIGGITQAGIIDDISRLFIKLGRGNLFITYSLIVCGSVLFSAFIDNIPYVAAMLPVVAGIASAQGFSPYVLYFGLLVGATLGGNLTPIGASANITAISILRRTGYEVSIQDFMRISIPFTLIAVLAGYIFCWLVWS